MDAIIKYLPSPTERPPVHDAKNTISIRKPEKTEKLSAYVFKLIND